MKYYVAIAAFFIAVASFGGDRIERAARTFVGSTSAADCRAAIPKGSSLGQAAMYVIAHCEDPPAGCRPNIPPEKLQGKTYREVEIRALIACGTRAELQADFNLTRDKRNRQIAAAQSAFIAQNQAASARQQAQQDRITADLNASIARSHADLNASIAQNRTDSKLDEISQGLRALRLGE